MAHCELTLEPSDIPPPPFSELTSYLQLVVFKLSMGQKECVIQYHP